jgi:hypothetical protein
MLQFFDYVDPLIQAKDVGIRHRQPNHQSERFLDLHDLVIGQEAITQFSGVLTRKFQ